jgi:hypothetical protein
MMNVIGKKYEFDDFVKSSRGKAPETKDEAQRSIWTFHEIVNWRHECAAS